MIDTTNTTLPALRINLSMQEAAHGFESLFLSEMLKFSGGLGTTDTPLGGIGEEQFSSLLVNHRADQISAKGGLGLAELIIRQYSSVQEKGNI